MWEAVARAMTPTCQTTDLHRTHTWTVRGLGMPEASERRREVVVMWNADVDPQRLDRRMIRRLLLFWFLGACFV